MGLQEARDILYWNKLQLDVEQAESYSYRKQQFCEALEFVIDKLDREIASYCNLP
jgi:hypothetical protein